MIKKTLLMMLAAVLMTASCTTTTPTVKGERLYDTAGNLINAHGAGVLFYQGTYYLFGEHKTTGDEGNRAQVGVHCYSSRDLVKWTDEGIALSVDPDGSNSDIEKGCILERPKVVFNAKNGKFVMWFHLERKGMGYSDALSGVASSDSPTGPYKFLHAQRPNGQMARDMTIFVDDDAKAYHIFSSEDNKTMHIAELTDDYTDHTGKYERVFEDRYMEAPAMFKRNGKYYLMMSGCTGWRPNAARSAVADSIWGPWTELGNPCVGNGFDTSFDTQSTYVLQLPGKDRYLYMGDRWFPDNAEDGRYVWLPIRWEGERFLIDSPYPELQAPFSIAHRSAHINGLIPENSPAGVAMAARYGFRAIELDAHYTKDSVIIIMHDHTINRTMRNAADYSEIQEPVRYADLTYAELRDNYVLASSDSSLRTPIPTLKEQLEACKQYGMIPLMHTNVIEAYKMAHEMLGDNFIAFNADYNALVKAREISAGCLILWDPRNTNAYETVKKLDAIGGRCGISSMKNELLTSNYIRYVREAGYEVQSSIWRSPSEMSAYDRGATIILSDFSYIPTRKGCEDKTLSPWGAETVPAAVAVSKDSKSIAAGEKILLSWDKQEFGAIELSIKYSGSIELVVNDKFRYPMEHGTNVSHIDGWRFHNLVPTVEITALEDSSVEYQASIYAF